MPRVPRQLNHHTIFIEKIYPHRKHHHLQVGNEYKGSQEAVDGCPMSFLPLIRTKLFCCRIYPIEYLIFPRRCYYYAHQLWFYFLSFMF